jgi:hypothetical protein
LAGLGVVGAVVTAHDATKSGMDCIGEGPGLLVSRFIVRVRLSALTTCRAHEESYHPHSKRQAGLE